MEKTNNFVPMFDLDRLSDEQLRQYYLDACAYHGVPPELNVLAFTLMDSGDGARRRVLYAKKGATDIIRDRLGISVVDLRKEVFNGTLTYTCFGKNVAGRLEIAVGASYIEGVTGRALEVAIMVAQTRAVRRMTLQFAGAGLLDETELQADSKTTDIKDVLSTTPQPSVKANAAPGKDITPVLAEDLQGSSELLRGPDRKKGYGPTQNPPIEGVSLQEISSASKYPEPPPGAAERVAAVLTSQNFAHPIEEIHESHKHESTKAQLDAQEALTKVNPAVLAKEAGETLPEAPKRRSRQKPVELDVPFSLVEPQPIIQGVKVPLETSEVIPKEVLNAVPAPVIAKAAFEFLDTVQKATEAVTAATPKAGIPVLPNDGQIKAFRDKLFKYTSEILPKAGMVPTESVGGIGMKVRIFAQVKFGQVLNQLSVEQWEEMFKQFDSLTPAQLVKLIDETAIKAKT
jgi:hypothetical protein